MREKPIQSRIFAAVGSHPDVRVFRNNVGVAWQGDAKRLPNGDVIISNPRRVVYGLCEGSSDLIGLRSVTVTPAMVGSRIAQFAAVEVKGSKGRATDRQLAFLRMVQDLGGTGGVARSVEDAQDILGIGASGQSNFLTKE